MDKGLREVVVTGLGIISSAGFDKEEFLKNICSGFDGTGPITSIDTRGFRRTNAAEIKAPLEEVEAWKHYSRVSQMALLATRNALMDAGLHPNSTEGTVGISISTMHGGAPEMEKWYCENEGKAFSSQEKGLLSQFSLQSVANTLAYEFNVKGPQNTVMCACASGTIAIGTAYKWILSGRADMVICGGMDAFRPLTHLEISAFRIASPDKVRPFDAKRKGILIGEGAGILILESKDSAVRRNADIYCKVLGYGASCDAYDLAHPEENGAGIILAMEKALNSSDIAKEDIGYINAHGTGTVKNDSAETAAVKAVFGEHAYKLHMSSIKGSVGHTLAAAGGIEAVATVMALHSSILPPTINYEAPDPICDLNVVPNEAIHAEVKAAISDSFGFGGNNAVIIFGRV